VRSNSALSMLPPWPEAMANQELILLRPPDGFSPGEFLPQKLAKQVVGEDPAIDRVTNNARLQRLQDGQYLNRLGLDGLRHMIR